MKREYKGELIPPESDDFTSNRNLFNYQAKVIKALAEEESCVIIGRCADFILKDRPNVVSVFVHASPEYCLEQAIAKVPTAEKTWSVSSRRRTNTVQNIIGIIPARIGMMQETMTCV